MSAGTGCVVVKWVFIVWEKTRKSLVVCKSMYFIPTACISLLREKGWAYIEDILDLEPLREGSNVIKLKLPYKRTRIDWLDRIFGLTLFSSGRIMFSINVPQKALRLQIKQKQHEDWNILALLLVFKSCNFLLLILRIYKILHILLSCSFQQCPYFYIYTGGVPSALQTHSLGL